VFKRRHPLKYSFWSFQLTGWLVYVLASTVATFPFRSHPDNLVYRGAFLLCGFIESLALHWLCRELWNRRIALLGTLIWCVPVSYGLGVVCAAVATWTEIHVGGSTMRLRWALVFYEATGASFVLIAWSALYFGIKHYQALEKERLRVDASESLARDAQLRALRYQLHPHFLFNTLNAVSTLVLDNQPTRPVEMITRLADLLRGTLKHPERHQTTLAEELAMLEEYLAIEKVRFGERLTELFEVSPQVLNVQIPRFLLQPLAENAVRHGIAQRPRGGTIVFRAGLNAGQLQIQIENEGMPYFTRVWTAPTEQTRLGLQNTRERLSQMYNNSASLEVRSMANGNFCVVILMPARFEIEAKTSASAG